MFETDSSIWHFVIGRSVDETIKGLVIIVVVVLHELRINGLFLGSKYRRPHELDIERLALTNIVRAFKGIIIGYHLQHTRFMSPISSPDKLKVFRILYLVCKPLLT